MKREAHIETLRGLAIILMVLGHVVGTDSAKGLKVSEDSWYYYLFYIFQYVRMPLFTVISGYVYALKPVTPDYDSKEFVVRKIRRLLIPYFVAAFLFFLMQLSVPGTNSSADIADLPFIFVKSYMHFWFAQGIFFVFLIVLLLEKLRLINHFWRWLILLVITVAIFMFAEISTTFLSIDKWPFLLLFFLWGLGLKRFEIQYKNKSWTKWMKGAFIAIFSSFFLLQQIEFFTAISDDIFSLKDRLYTTAIGLSSAFLLVNMNWSNKIFCKIGNFSYEIYLYHIFATAGCRILLFRVGIKDLFINLLLGLILGVLAPIFLKILISRYPKINALLFGDKVKTKKSNWC